MDRRILLLWMGALTVFLFPSCDDVMILKSEKKMKEDLQGEWLRSFQGQTPYILNCPSNHDSAFYEEHWTFNGSNLHTTFHYGPYSCDRGTPDFNKTDRVDTVLVCTFNVDARLTRAYLKLQLISGLVPNDSTSEYFDKWEFVELSDDVLYLATDARNNSGVEQREFSKIK